MWSAGGSETRELFDYSRRKFGVELPLAREVLHISHFCWELQCFYNSNYDSLKLELQKEPPKKAILKWWHFYGTGARTDTLEVPEAIVWKIRGQCLEILQEKCEELAEMCGWYKDHPKKD